VFARAVVRLRPHFYRTRTRSKITMPTRSDVPPKINLDIPAESAIFQHSPSPDTRLKVEWEPGCQPDEVYDRALPRWRAWLRRYLVKRLRIEKVWMADLQGRMRTEFRDRYFYWTAIFGSEYSYAIRRFAVRLIEGDVSAYILGLRLALDIPLGQPCERSRVGLQAKSLKMLMKDLGCFM